MDAAISLSICPSQTSTTWRQLNVEACGFTSASLWTYFCIRQFTDNHPELGHWTRLKLVETSWKRLFLKFCFSISEWICDMARVRPAPVVQWYVTTLQCAWPVWPPGFGGSEFNSVLRQLVGTCRSAKWLISRAGSASILLNLWQTTRTGTKGARISSASQRWDNRWSWLSHYWLCTASEKPNVQA